MQRAKGVAGLRMLPARERLNRVDKKFVVGKNPLEQERELDVIVPRNQEQLNAMVKVIDELYPPNSAQVTPQQRQAVELWKFQIQQETASDQVKFNFVRDFYFWLIGRGVQEDHKNTSWGRANVAIYNPEVAGYIDQFAKKRMEFALQLSLLKSRIPETLLGYYLYFKYIVRGKLEVRHDSKTGYDFYDISNEDFLQDFDLFKNVFAQQNEAGTKTKMRDGYAEVAAGLVPPAASPAYTGNAPYPSNDFNAMRETGISAKKQEQRVVDAARNIVNPKRVDVRSEVEVQEILGTELQTPLNELEANAAPSGEAVIAPPVTPQQSATVDGKGKEEADEDSNSFGDNPYSPITPRNLSAEASFAEVTAFAQEIALSPKTAEEAVEYDALLKTALNDTIAAEAKTSQEVIAKVNAVTALQRALKANRQHNSMEFVGTASPTVATPRGKIGATRDEGRNSSVMTPVSVQKTPAVNLTTNASSVTDDLELSSSNKANVTRKLSLLTPEKKEMQKRVTAADAKLGPPPPQSLQRNEAKTNYLEGGSDFAADESAREAVLRDVVARAVAENSLDNNNNNNNAEAQQQPIKWLKRGKVFEQGDLIFKIANDDNEYLQKREFAENNPAVTASLMRSDVADNGDRVLVFRNLRSEGFVSLKDMDKRAMTKEQASKLVSALEQAYEKLAYDSYNGVIQPNNVAVRKTLSGYEVKFYEGDNPNNKTVNRDKKAQARVYLSKLFNDPKVPRKLAKAYGLF